MAIAKLSLVVVLSTGYLHVVHSQLIGSRGVFSLPEGESYRDPETVKASKDVARFARSYQVSADRSSSQRRSYGNQLSKIPRFFTRKTGQKGRKLTDSEVFDFVDSRYVNPLPETKFNKPLEEVDVERATPPTRLFPGETRFGPLATSAPYTATSSIPTRHVSSLRQRTFSAQHAANYYNGAPLRAPAGVPIRQANTAAVLRQPVATVRPAVLGHGAVSSALPAPAHLYPSHSYVSSYEVGLGAAPTAYHTDRVPSVENFYILNNQRIN